MAAWIERSLERLEWLEAESERLARHGDPQSVTTLCEFENEISALYEVLEAVASDGDPEPAARELFLGDQPTLTFIEFIGWTTQFDLQPLPPPVAEEPLVVPKNKWMLPTIAGFVLMAAGSLTALLMSGSGVEATLAQPESAAAPPVASAIATVVEPEPEPEPEPTPVAAAAPTIEKTAAKRKTKRRKKWNRRRSGAKQADSRSIELGKGRNPLSGL